MKSDMFYIYTLDFGGTTDVWVGGSIPVNSTDLSSTLLISDLKYDLYW